MGKPEGKRPLERPRHRWEDGIGIDLREIGWGSVEWIQMAQDRDRCAGSCEYGDEPLGSGAMELVSFQSSIALVPSPCHDGFIPHPFPFINHNHLML
jgi:hypothetical protein